MEFIPRSACLLSVIQWLLDHPKFMSNELYVGGDSYSGFIVPIIVQEIYNGNLWAANVTLNIYFTLTDVTYFKWVAWKKPLKIRYINRCKMSVKSKKWVLRVTLLFSNLVPFSIPTPIVQFDFLGILFCCR
jgi:hypothetical protein